MKEYEAIRLLGNRHVLTMYEACVYWRRWPQNDPPPEVLYTSYTLERAAQQNLHNQDKWRLVFLVKISISEMIFTQGIWPWVRRYPCFDPCPWEGQTWTKNVGLFDSYLLMNFRGQFGFMSHGQQEMSMAANHWLRPGDASIMQALIGFRSKRGETLAAHFEHWGENRIGRQKTDYPTFGMNNVGSRIITGAAFGSDKTRNRQAIFALPHEF